MSFSSSRALSSSNASGLPRRASLALPFVITVAAASCTPRPVEEPTAAPVAGEDEATPVIISNPPQPQPTEQGTKPDPSVSTPEAGPVAPTDGPAPVIMRNPPPPAAGEVSDSPKIAPVDPASAGTRPAPALPKAPATGGVVSVRADGTCWWQASVTCPPKTMCNPPPPNQVQCPATKPVANPTGSATKP